MFQQNIKFLGQMLWLGALSTDYQDRDKSNKA